MFLAVGKETLIDASISIFQDTMTIHHSVFPHSFVFVTVLKNCFPFLINLIIMKCAIVLETRFLLIRALPLLHSLIKFALINGSITPFLPSKTMRLISFKLTFILVFFAMVDQLPFSSSHIVPDISFIVCSVFIYHSPFNINISFSKEPLIQGTIGEEQGS